MMASNHTSYDDLEENRKVVNVTLVQKEPCISEQCIAKCCISTTLAIIVYPFIICDMYYALTDNSCVNQPLDDLVITMQQYLFASSIIGIVAVSIANTCLISFNLFKCIEEGAVCWQIIRWISRIFQLSWLILGCVMLWGKMDLSKCSEPVHAYLFARFIIFIILSAGDSRVSTQKNEN